MGYKRFLQNNSFYHIYNRGNKKELIFKEESDYKMFLSKMFFYQREYHFIIYSYCLMPNHYHLVIQSGSVCNEIPIFMHRFTLSYVKYYNKRYEYVGHMFQSRYRIKLIQSKRGLVKLRRYLEENPVKAGMVQDSKFYRWEI